jgi:threonine/homoserine/homoserine lactone efflux protein
MQNLFILLVILFAAMALLVFTLQRFGNSADVRSASRLHRWIPTLVGLVLVLSALEYFFRGG